jgi:phospholipid transport system substrate-binding protein
MRPNKAGDWLVRNVTIDSVNVGQLYQNQFLAAMKKQNNNFSKVIDNWVIEQADLKRDAASK